MAAELIVGLDVSTRAQAQHLVEALDGVADFFKIGYQLVYGGDGLALGRDLLAAGKRVFFDLKLLDIDNTVAHGVAAIADTGATMMTVHAYPKTMAAAVGAAQGSRLCLLGVSVLTSMDQTDIEAAGYGLSIEALVARRAAQARDAGMGGLVASALEAAAIRTIVGPAMAVVTPGIRLHGDAAGDQKRVVSPSQAIASGASHLVIARPIIAATDPRAAAHAVLADMARANERDISGQERAS